MLLATISGVVFADTNFNGVKDASEPGIAGRTVYLDLDDDRVLDADTVSNWTGQGLPKTVGELGSESTSFFPSNLLGVVKDVDMTVGISSDQGPQLVITGSASPTTGTITRTIIDQNFEFAGFGDATFTFDDEADSTFFRPEESFAAFDGMSPNVQFSMQMRDAIFNVNGDNTTFRSASIRLVTGEPTATTGADGSFTFQLPALAPGTYKVRQLVPAGSVATLPGNNNPLNAVVSSTSSNVTGINFGTTALKNITGFVFEDLNGNGTKDTGENPITNTTVFLDRDGDGLNDGLATVTRNSNDTLPKAITGGTTIGSSLNVAGLPGLLSDLNVTLNITHPNDTDLSAFLISPGGTRVQLYSNIGNAGDNFTNTTLDDQAATSITTAAAPFTGSFKPVGSLASFNNLNPNGRWLLEINSNNPTFGGSLKNWSITFTSGEPVASYSSTNNYFFANLFPGQYSIAQEVPSGLIRIKPDSGVQPLTFLSNGGFSGATNFAMQRPVSLSGKVFQDNNGNGFFDSAEAALPDQSVFLDQDNNFSLAPPTFTTRSNGVDAPIPDNGRTSSAIAVSGLDPLQPVTDVNVQLSILHPHDDQLDVFLISPQGTRVELFTDVGGSGANFTATTLDDEATTGIAAGTAPFTGSFKPEGLLSAFDGQNPNGTWRLEVDDDTAGSTGTLDTWTLTLRTAESFVQTDAQGNFRFTGLRPGTYHPRELLPAGGTFFNTTQRAGNSVTAASGANLALNIGQARSASVSGQVFNNLNADSIKDPSDPPLPGRTVFLDLNNNGILDPTLSTTAQRGAGAVVPDLTSVASLTTVSGFSGRILDLNVTFNFTHPNDGDLAISLVSPSGRLIGLVNRIGGTGDNFTNTTLDDQASTSITTAAAPFTGTFKPAVSLAAFNGEDPNGQWALVVRDAASGNVGHFGNWTLHFTLGEPSAVTDANGNYVVGGQIPGNYTLRQVLPPGDVQTFPAGTASTGQSLFLPTGAAINKKDLGTTTQTPFLGTPFQISSAGPVTIECEDFDLGGEGVAYHDTTAGNNGALHRTTDDVDIKTTADPAGGAFRIGTTAPTEFLRYSVNVVNTGLYDFDFRVSSPDPGATFHLELDGRNVTGSLAVPDTNAFDSMTTVTRSSIFLQSGLHILRLVIDTGTGLNANFAGSFNFIKVSPHAQ